MSGTQTVESDLEEHSKKKRGTKRTIRGADETVRSEKRKLFAQRRRQLGAEKILDPMSPIHEPPSLAAIVFGRITILLVIFSWLMYVITTIIREFLNNPNLGFRFSMEAVFYLIVVTGLGFSALMYLVTRQGALYRFRDHLRVPRGVLDRHFGTENQDHSITVLIPSYVEELSVVKNTIWSAALQEFPSINIVLLIDDPPKPTDPERIASLEATRLLTGQIEQQLREPLRAAQTADGLLRAILRNNDPNHKAVAHLVSAYQQAAGWIETLAKNEPVEDHMDDFFVNRVLLGLSSELRLVIIALDAMIAQDSYPEKQRLLELSQRLIWIFSAKVSYFERKQYRSLSKEANKAMNLNSYIGLMGQRLVREETAEGVVLTPRSARDGGEILYPDSTYLLTLDADSMLLREYCLRLVYLMEEAGNEQIAVAQTPYSSYRGAPTRIERIAGATTDVQHVLHQGMAYYNAAFWVGANAVIRKAALNDIVEIQSVGGFEIRTYIQDRTVIEDTESSIDLGTHGWKIMNYPERLSYSATPPDFGSLVVQRRRWANGGLLIMTKFSKQIRSRKLHGDKPTLRERMIRTNYMASLSWASFGLAFLLAYPYDSRLLSLWVLGIGIPYFWAMGLDLRASGHRFSDIFRIYGFNLILLAVNIAGVIKSIQQALTGEKIPFARTPKVSNRTAAQPLYILVPWLIIIFSLITFWRDYQAENWGNAIFAAFNTLLCFYAIIAYIGVRNSFVDIVVGAINWVMVDKSESKEATPSRSYGKQITSGSQHGHDKTKTDWRAILYFGDRRIARDVRKQGELRRRRQSH